MPKSLQARENELCQEGINPVTVQSKNDRLNILRKATKSVERPKRKLSTAPGRLLTSRTMGAKRAAADAEKNPAMQVPAKVGEKAAANKVSNNLTKKTSRLQQST